MYQCNCCATGVMSTAEQYLTHINSQKHKKKAFALQAPFAGIDYEEFRPKTVAKPQAAFISTTEDFPQLPEQPSVGAVAGPSSIQYSDIRESFNDGRVSSSNQLKTNGHCSFDENEENENEYKPTSIDDVFFKDQSRIANTQFTINSYTKNNKTASAALNEIAVQMHWQLEFEQVPASNQKYGFMVRIDGFNLVSGEGDNKKEAKQHASSEAIKVIRMKLKKVKAQDNKPIPVQCNRQINFKRNEHPADAYCRLTIDKLLEIENLRNNKFVVPRRFAAFIITDKIGQAARDGHVVAFGAGNGVLKRTESVQKHPGYHVTNFDSLVIAKRSLQCFFANQLSLLFDRKLSKNTAEKVYFTVGKNGKVKLMEGCRIHLFMSHAPYGDCVDSLSLDWTDPKVQINKETDRDRNGVLEPIMYMTYNSNQYVKQPGHIRILKDDLSGGWISLVEYRNKRKIAPDYMVMSPSDKLMSWIHVGVQGALLSHLLDPIYLYSVQVAHNYVHDHFSRALICRVPLESLSHYPGLSNFKDPYIGRVTQLPEPIMPLQDLERSNVSYNWYENQATDLAEIIDNESGIVHRDSPFRLPNGELDFTCSRISKVCMLVRLKKIFKLAIDYYALRPELQRTRNLQGIGDAAKYHYNLYKNSAIDYRRLKQALFQVLHEKKYGEWAPNNSANNFDLLQYYELSD